MSSVTTVLGKGDSLSSLKGRAVPPLATSAASLEPSITPSSRSKRQCRVTRHQDAQEPLGQPRDHRADRSELGFELQVQFRELCATSECGRVDNAIVRGGVRVIAITWAATSRNRTRACRLLGVAGGLLVFFQRR